MAEGPYFDGTPLVFSEALNLPVLVLTFGLNEILIIFQCLVGIKTQTLLTRRPYPTIINPSSKPFVIHFYALQTLLFRCGSTSSPPQTGFRWPNLQDADLPHGHHCRQHPYFSCSYSLVFTIWPSQLGRGVRRLQKAMVTRDSQCLRVSTLDNTCGGQTKP